MDIITHFPKKKNDPSVQRRFHTFLLQLLPTSTQQHTKFCALAGRIFVCVCVCVCVRVGVCAALGSSLRVDVC
jgi:hypothetical protein